MKHPEFTSGAFDTNFVNIHFKPQMLKQEIDRESALLAAFISAQLINNSKQSIEYKSTGVGTTVSKWKGRRV